MHGLAQSQQGRADYLRKNESSLRKTKNKAQKTKTDL